jgi:hypothetical protein
MRSSDQIAPIPEIRECIHWLRGKPVMLDADPARVYAVATRDLNKAVARNPNRFPEDFSFVPTSEETRNLMLQIGESSSQNVCSSTPTRVFTEQGVAMPASVPHSVPR